MIRDFFSNVQLRRLIDADEGAGSNSPKVSQIVDVANAGSVLLAIVTGTLADSDAVFSVKVEEDDDPSLGSAALVALEHLQLDPKLAAQPAAAHQAAFSFADDNQQMKIGYLGGRRYLRLTITPADNSGAWDIAAVAILGQLRKVPA